ncbi:MAG: matrixin family metalloprotease [Deltaproteobacteria bacterium]|nr:matrixin family metalloprotease [Deltaproteobacteria bacterium]
MRAPIILAGIAVAAVATAFSAYRDPNRHDGVRWATGAVEVSIQQDGSDDIGDGSDVAALQQAVATWAEALAPAFTLSQGALSSSRGYGNDGVNRITFIESGFPGGTDSALGTAIPSIVTGDPSRLVDVDVLLNGEHQGTWSVDGRPTGIDIRSVAMHELGHLVGLSHSYRSESVMYTGAQPGTTFRRALSDDDLRGARLLTSGGLGCGEERDCPLLIPLAGIGGSPERLTCSGDTCLPGAVGYGLDCLDNGHCTSGLCLRDPAAASGADPGACTEVCTPGSCPGGDLCRDVGGGALRCVPGRECASDSDCGALPNTCLFDADGRYRCGQLCRMDSQCQAPARCIDLGYGLGVCKQPGPAPNGAECLQPLICAGLACRGDGQTLSCATAPPYQDGGALPDVPHVGDGGWRPDALGSDGGAPADRATSSADGDPGPGDDGPPGCACAARETQGAALALALVPLLVLAGRRRARSGQDRR